MGPILDGKGGGIVAMLNNGSTKGEADMAPRVPFITTREHDAHVSALKVAHCREMKQQSEDSFLAGGIIGLIVGFIIGAVLGAGAITYLITGSPF